MTEHVPPPPPMTDPDEYGEPKAVIVKSGRRYHVTIEHGIMELTPGWVRNTRAGAERTARRELERYRRQQAEQRERWVIE